MSIYATSFMIHDERLDAAELEEAGIGHAILDEDGVVEDLDTLPPDDLDAPIVYEGSHVLPSDDDRRGGCVDLAVIPPHIERGGCDDAPREDGRVFPWLRLGVSAEPSELEYEGKPYTPGGHVTVILTRSQVTRLRDSLDDWLRGVGE